MIDTAIEKSQVVDDPDASEGRRTAKAGKGFTRKQGQPTTGGSVGSLATGYAANQSQNLSKVC